MNHKLKKKFANAKVDRTITLICKKNCTTCKFSAFDMNGRLSGSCTFLPLPESSSTSLFQIASCESSNRRMRGKRPYRLLNNVLYISAGTSGVEVQAAKH